MRELRLVTSDVYATQGFLGLADIWQLSELDRPDVRVRRRPTPQLHLMKARSSSSEREESR
jgi:polyphosphate kinase